MTLPHAHACSTELFSYEACILYTVLTAVPNLDRVALKDKVVDAPEILTLIDAIPHLAQFLNALYECRYDDFFRARAHASSQGCLEYPQVQARARVHAGVHAGLPLSPQHARAGLLLHTPPCVRRPPSLQSLTSMRGNPSVTSNMHACVDRPSLHLLRAHMGCCLFSSWTCARRHAAPNSLRVGQHDLPGAMRRTLPPHAIGWAMPCSSAACHQPWAGGALLRLLLVQACMIKCSCGACAGVCGNLGARPGGPLPAQAPALLRARSACGRLLAGGALRPHAA